MKKPEYKHWIYFAFFFGIAGLVVYVGFFIALFQQNQLDTDTIIDLSKSSYIGAFLSGAVGTVWALVSVILLYQTFVLQRKQFLVNRDEIRTTKFENTYFNMLQNLQGIIGSMVSDTQIMAEPEVQGRMYLRYLADKYLKKIKRDKSTVIAELKKTYDDELVLAEKIKDVVIEVYEKDIFQYHSFNLGHYFRYIYNIIKYVRNNIAEEKKRKEYLSFLQAQLSNDELCFILYNSLSFYSNNKDDIPQFRYWLDDYNLMENIDSKYVIDKSLLKKYFPKTNFFINRK